VLLFRVCNGLLKYGRSSKVEEVVKVEGAAFGVLPYAFNDWVLQGLAKIMVRGEKSCREYGRLCAETGLEETLFRMLAELNSRSDISPRGMVAFLMVCLELCLGEGNSFGAKVLKGVGLSQLLVLMSESQVLAVQEWPAGLHGGGTACLHLMTVNLLKLLNLSLQLYD
jgi:hypothetical protein